jgi:hypothetical protein
MKVLVSSNHNMLSYVENHNQVLLFAISFDSGLRMIPCSVSCLGRKA